MNQIFNELSASSCYPTKQEARLGMEKLANLIRSMSIIGFSRHMLTTKNFSTLLLTANFTINDWATERKTNIDRDLQRFILQSAGFSPYIEDLLNESEDKELMEFIYESQKSLGLGLAALQKTGVLSLDGDKRFTTSPIQISCFSTDGVSETHKTINVPSIYDESSQKEFIKWHKNSLLQNCRRPKDILNKCKYLFPYLSINEQAKNQLIGMTGNENFFHVILEHLSILNKAMENWSSGPFILEGIEWSVESQKTMQHYSDKRNFLCNDGVKRIFNYHTKIRGPNQRIYFIPVPENRIIHIGYIGTHLPV